MIFVNSMSDLFHDDVPDEFIAKVFAVMALSSQHTFQVLTKRPRRMQALLGNNPSWCLSIAQEFLALVPEMGRTLFHERWPGWPIPNVWLGASVEDQKRADLRIPLLLETPAAVRFLSCEPLLGPLDLWAKASNRGGIFTNCPECDGWGGRIRGTGEHGGFDTKCFGCNGAKIVPGVSWIICGGESGSGYRPMEIEWAQGLADMCEKVGIPFFMKQDSGPRPGTQGRIPDDLWARKEFPR
jgi:protein gp37